LFLCRTSFGPSIATEGRFAAPMDDRRFALVDVCDVAAAALIEEAHAAASYVNKMGVYG